MLEVNDLDVFYGPIQALHGLSLKVQDGEAVAVLGANGAGKSTLIKTIMGFLKPRQGEIRFGGEVITHLPSWERVSRGLALVPEGGRVFRDLSVTKNLRLGAYLRDERQIRAQMDFVLDLFPVLAERKDQVAKTLSGGEQQMLAIARAMMSDPKLLLVDEVSMGLMPILVRRVFGVLKSLSEGGVSILLVEQNAFEALKVVDRAYVLENGQIVLDGAPEDLAKNERVKAAYLGG